MAFLDFRILVAEVECGAASFCNQFSAFGDC